jgi:hypothetical protein
MSDQGNTPQEMAGPPPMPQTTALMLSTLAELHRQETGAEEDVFRTLPFFGAALGLVIAALVYAGGRLPRLSDLATNKAVIAFAVSSTLVGLAAAEAICVILLLFRAVTLRPYQRIGPEQSLCDRAAELQAYYEGLGTPVAGRDNEVTQDMQQALIESYAKVTPINRAFNARRYRWRYLAAINLLGSLLLAVVATIVIFGSDKVGFLPKVVP